MPSNEYYDSSGVPATSSSLNSSVIRAEFLKVQNIGDLLPVMSENGNYFCCVNAGGTGLTSVSPSAAATKMGSELISERDAESSHVGMTLFKINFMDSIGEVKSFLTNANTVSRTYTFPDKDGTIATTADTETVNARVTASNLVISSNTVNIATNAANIETNTNAIASVLEGVYPVPTVDDEGKVPVVQADASMAYEPAGSTLVALDMTSLSTVTLNTAAADVFYLHSVDTDFTLLLSNAVVGRTVVIFIDNSSLNTITWPSIRWPDGETPEMSEGIDVITLTVVAPGVVVGSYALNHIVSV